MARRLCITAASCPNCGNDRITLPHPWPTCKECNAPQPRPHVHYRCLRCSPPGEYETIITTKEHEP